MQDHDDHDDDHDHHDDHHDDHEDDTIVTTTPTATPTEQFPRPGRLRTAGLADEPTRLDVHRAYDVPDPTVAATFDPRVDGTTMRTGQRVTVSPIGAHTVGAAAATPPEGIPAVDTLNALLDDRDRLRGDRQRIDADTRRTWRGRPPVRTIREVAAARAAAKLRHEQHLERVETVRAYVTLLIFIALLIIVIGAGVVGYGIISGYFEWAPVRTR